MVNFSSRGVGCAAYVETKLLTYAMRLPINLMPGYNGNEDQHGDAARRNHGHLRVAFIGGMNSSRMATPVTSPRSAAADKDTPQLSTYADTPEAKAMVTLIQSQGDMSRLTATTPGVPAPQLEALRAAYKASMEDKELQAKAEKGGRPVEPVYGDDVLKMVKAALNQSPQTGWRCSRKRSAPSSRRRPDVDLRQPPRLCSAAAGASPNRSGCRVGAAWPDHSGNNRGFERNDPA